MKAIKKVLLTALLTAAMVFNVVAGAGAATIKDGSYTGTADWGEISGIKVTVNMDVLIYKGKVSEAEIYFFASGNRIVESWMPRMSEENRPIMQNVFDYGNKYIEQMLNEKTGDKVVADSADTSVYAIFVTMWNDIAEQAGGTPVSTASPAGTTTAEPTVAPSQDATDTTDATMVPTVKKTKVTLYLKGTNKKLTYKIAVKDADGFKVTYKSSKASVAVVTSKGVITAKKAGTANIVVTFTNGTDTHTETVKVTVKAK